MKTAQSRFVIMWDNAYAFHDLYGVSARAPDIMRFAQESGTQDRVWIFGSFSKVTLASAGLGLVSASPNSLAWFKKSLSVQTIGPDKQRQLQHLLFLKNMGGIRALMNKHRRILLPKFKTVQDGLEKAIGGKGIADWTKPDGGYFISLTMRVGSAKTVIKLAKNVGLKLTEAGAAFPLGADPHDNHIRIAPTYPSIENLRRATYVLALCAEIAHREKHPQTSSSR
jgi:DNA-binding transcriptional MocR family regulator